MSKSVEEWKAARAAKVEAIHAEVEQRHAIERRLMAEEGIAEIDESGSFGFGLDFFVRVTPLPEGLVSLRVGALSHDRETDTGVGNCYPRPGLLLSADRLLEAFADVWPSLAAPYLTAGAGWPESFEIDFGEAKLGFRNDRGALVVVGDEAVSLGTQGMMAVEAVRIVADEMVRRELVSSAVAERWAALSAATDLPPAVPDNGIARGFDEAATRLYEHGEAEWYARKYGMSSEEWRRRAVWFWGSRVISFKAGTHCEEENLATSTVPVIVDERGDFDRLIAEAASAIGVSVDEAYRDALDERHCIARAEFLWPRETARREAEERAAG